MAYSVNSFSPRDPGAIHGSYDYSGRDHSPDLCVGRKRNLASLRLATVAVLLVALCIARFARYSPSPGSLYTWGISIPSRRGLTASCPISTSPIWPPECFGFCCAAARSKGSWVTSSLDQPILLAQPPNPEGRDRIKISNPGQKKFHWGCSFRLLRKWRKF